jgi:hypothetical protein
VVGLAHTIASRIAAAAVALALTGVPQLVEPQGHSAGHRCHCPIRNGTHDCDCPLCHAEAARLGRAAADDPGLPPCHRALAVKARAEAGQAAQRRAAPGPCLTSSCGGSDSKLLPPPASERFTVPQVAELIGIEVAGEVASAQDVPLSVHRELEPPPPRGA